MPLFPIQPAFNITSGRQYLWEMAIRFCKLREPLGDLTMCLLHPNESHITIVCVCVYESAVYYSPIKQEGVPSHLLPAVVQAQKEAAAEAAAKDKEKVHVAN